MYSELVDDLVLKSGRPDVRANLQGWVNNTVREVQVSAYFNRDLTEDQITATASPHIFTRPTRMRTLRTASYVRNAAVSYPRFVRPGRLLERVSEYYYLASTYYVFAGVNAGDLINIAYYSYARRFQYYDVGQRPAVYDRATETWSYLSGGVYVPTLGTTAADEAAQDLVSHWLLADWYDVIFAGALATMYAHLEDVRKGTQYSMYQQGVSSVLKGEVLESVGS